MIKGPQDILDLHYLVQSIIWRYQLDEFEIAAIKQMLDVVRFILNEIKRDLLRTPTKYQKARLENIAQELQMLSVGLRHELGEYVERMIEEVFTATARRQAEILSLGGLVAGVQFARLTPKQIKALTFAEAARGVSIEKAWGWAFPEGLKKAMAAGMAKGESYATIVENMMKTGQVKFEQEAITVARTFVQSANVAATMETYKENDDVVEGWTWSSALESGTCMRCAALDGQIFKLGEGPEIPLHPRCRCVALPKVSTWRELGLDEKVFEKRVRPWTIREAKNIDTGGKRKILDYGMHDGDFASWFEKRPAAFKNGFVGPKRYQLLKDGKIGFCDLVDKDGNLRTLKDLDELINDRKQHH